MSTPPAVDLSEVISEVKKFFTKQGALAQLLAELLMVTDVSYHQENGTWILELTVKIPEISSTGQLIFATKKILYDINNKAIIGIATEPKQA